MNVRGTLGEYGNILLQSELEHNRAFIFKAMRKDSKTQQCFGDSIFLIPFNCIGLKSQLALLIPFNN